MGPWFMTALLLTNIAWAKDVKKFNKILIENVDKDIRAENDEQFKVKDRRLDRRPASKAPMMPEPENKIDKNVRQTGSDNW